MTLLEGVANALATASILLAGRNSVHTWWTGIAGCSLFALLFWDTRLYADVLLQVFFVGASVVGWWYWSRHGERAELPIGRAGSVEEIAPTAVMLASDEGAYYVGATLNPNGGDVMV